MPSAVTPRENLVKSLRALVAFYTQGRMKDSFKLEPKMLGEQPVRCVSSVHEFREAYARREDGGNTRRHASH